MIMKNGLRFMFLTVIVFQAVALRQLDMIQKYFQEKSIKSAVIFGCFGRKEQINLAKTLTLQKRPMTIFSLEENKLDEKLKTTHQHLGVVLDGDCPKVTEFLIACGRMNFFDDQHHWLVLASSNNISKKFEQVKLNIDADIYVAVEDNENWIIFDLYNPASERGGVLNFTKIGFYDKKGYRVRNDEDKYWRRKNVTGVTFKSIVVLPVPFKGTLNNYLSSDDDRDINTFNRFHTRLTSFCQDYYNYSVIIKVDKSWGYTNPDGTFDGMVGALDKKNIDFGSSPLFLREDRARVIDYGRNTWILRAAFLFRNPKAKTSMEVFLQPLPTSVWLITGLLAIISIVIFKTVTTFERRKFHRSTETSWSVSVILTLGAFCQQGSPSTPKMTCGRIATISVFLLSVLIYQFYSGSLVSHLLMKPLTKIQSIKDILESSLGAGCEDILYDHDYFKHTTDKVAIELLKKKILGKKNTSNFFTPEYGLKLVERGGFAFHVETATAYPIIEETFAEKAICELREVQLFRTQPMHANYQKNSPFRDMFDTCYQRLAEYGILYRERRHWHPRRPECIMSSKSVSFHVGLDDLYPALVLLLVGIVTSLTVLVFEKQVQIIREKLVSSKRHKNPVFPFVH